MTKEQIERLFKLNPEHPVLVTDYISEVAAALPRLLEEREKLLEGARIVAAQDCGTPGCAHRACAQAAIAMIGVRFAEEAAP